MADDTRGIRGLLASAFTKFKCRCCGKTVYGVQLCSACERADDRDNDLTDTALEDVKDG